MPQTIFVQMDVQVITWLQNEATTPPPFGNLYPNSRKSGKKVEIPSIAGWKFLPKRRKSRKKGRDSQYCRSEISTQIAGNRRKR